MRIGIVVFPGTWSDEDCHMAFSEVLGVETTYVYQQKNIEENLFLLVNGKFF